MALPEPEIPFLPEPNKKKTTNAIATGNDEPMDMDIEKTPASASSVKRAKSVAELLAEEEVGEQERVEPIIECTYTLKQDRARSPSSGSVIYESDKESEHEQDDRKSVLSDSFVPGENPFSTGAGRKGSGCSL